MHDGFDRNKTALGRREVKEVSDGGHRRRPFPWVSALLFLVGGALGIGALLAWQARSTTAVAPLLDAQTIREKEKQIELQAVALKQKERIATAKSKLQSLLHDATHALDRIATFEKEIATWETSVVPLLENDRGRLLAADDTAVITFKSIYNKARPTQADGAALRMRMETLMAPLKLALSTADAAYTPSEDIRSSIERERQAAEALASAYFEPRAQIEGMVANAAKAQAPASVTLEEAIHALDARQAAEQAKRIAEAEEAERRKADETLAAARAAQVAQEAKNQVLQIEAKKVADQKIAEVEAQKTLDAAERERVRRAAQSPDVAKALSPFLAEGYWQPGRRPDQCTEKGPVSFSALRSSGAIENTPRGLQQLLTAGTALPNGRLQDQVRPRWGYPTHVASLSPAQLEALKTAQQYLRDYGPTLVELKMLAP